MRDPRARLRALLAREYAADGVILTDSGTSALQLAIRAALADAAGGPVALPAFSCYDVATAAIGAHARVILYDLDPGTLSPEPASFERALRRGARAAVVAPLYGVPVDWEPLRSLTDRHSTVLIEDAAQGQGASWRGRRLGSLGTLSIVSFGRGKGWTGGAGGALLWRGAVPPGVHPAARARAGAGPLAGAIAQWLLGRPSLYGIPSSLPWLGLGETRYHEPAPAHAMPRVAAALALATHPASVSAAVARRELADRLLERLPASVQRIRVPDHAQPGYLRLPIRAPGYAPALAAALRHLGVAGVYPLTLDRLPPLRDRLIAPSALPGAATLVRELVTLPTHGGLSDAEEDDLVASLARPELL
ncbi:MAG TPA: DegT/DnrJ/EryC1/StrS family aminotransferase [Longimicrobiales bacterium]